MIVRDREAREERLKEREIDSEFERVSEEETD